MGASWNGRIVGGEITSSNDWTNAGLVTQLDFSNFQAALVQTVRYKRGRPGKGEQRPTAPTPRLKLQAGRSLAENVGSSLGKRTTEKRDALLCLVNRPALLKAATAGVPEP
jgi:hypothetical protein